MRITWWCVALALLPGCRSGGGELEAGRLEATWEGFAAGRVVLPAEAVLCAEAGLAELVAVRGDTGVALGLFPLDSASLVAATFPVFHAGTPSELRPGAVLAVRWFDVTTLESFEGLEGEVRISEVGARGVTGEFQAELRGLSRSDSLTLRGRFREVPLVMAPAGCADSMRRYRVPVP